MNEKELKLEGAEFRLYSDPECREEVYVRENPDGEGYIVVNRDSLGGSDHTGEPRRRMRQQSYPMHRERSACMGWTAGSII